ncbi:MAG: hypothetical protein JWM28_4224 [Chitinophagaceae bacterium]|nr:hypothetical protein [Chitinophagaceae bacterium]
MKKIIFAFFAFAVISANAADRHPEINQKNLK